MIFSAQKLAWIRKNNSYAKWLKLKIVEHTKKNGNSCWKRLECKCKFNNELVEMPNNFCRKQMQIGKHSEDHRMKFSQWLEKLLFLCLCITNWFGIYNTQWTFHMMCDHMKCCKRNNNKAKYSKKKIPKPVMLVKQIYAV